MVREHPRRGVSTPDGRQLPFDAGSAPRAFRRTRGQLAHVRGARQGRPRTGWVLEAERYQRTRVAIPHFPNFFLCGSVCSHGSSVLPDSRTVGAHRSLSAQARSLRAEVIEVTPRHPSASSPLSSGAAQTVFFNNQSLVRTASTLINKGRPVLPTCLWSRDLLHHHLFRSRTTASRQQSAVRVSSEDRSWQGSSAQT